MEIKRCLCSAVDKTGCMMIIMMMALKTMTNSVVNF